MQRNSNDVLVSFSSNGREDYNKRLLRLMDSAKLHWKGDVLVYSPDHPLAAYNDWPIHHGWPQSRNLPPLTHAEMPYYFKYALIQHARELGYQRIVWLDTSMLLLQDITPLFDGPGVTVFDNLGHPLYKYISDEAWELARRHVAYDETGLPTFNDIPQIWGGAQFWDFTKTLAKMCWLDVLEFAQNGTFKDGTSRRPNFVAHRHDQAVLSVLLHNRCRLLPYGYIKTREHIHSHEYGNNPYILYG